MTRKKVSKSMRPLAEKASEHYLYHVCGCDIPQIRRAIRTKWQSVDFWACDVMGRTREGRCFFAQVTAGQSEAVRSRRRKLEKISWNAFDTVFVLQLVEQPNPANQRKKDFFFRVHRLFGTIWFVDSVAYPIPRGWFVKLKEVKP